MAQLFRKSVSVFIVFCFVLYPLSGYALPQGGVIVGGPAAGNIDSSVINELTVNQNEARLIANWESFSIASPETVTFNQPNSSSIALNRVNGGSPSQILGALNANGRVFLINPSGIVFGVNSSVDTAGLLASTLDITDADFLDGDDSFTFSGPGGSVINYGTIALNKPGGYAALLGSSVKNIGSIEAELGTVVLAAGEEITLNLDPAGTISTVVDIGKGTERNDEDQYAAVNNRGEIKANGGKVILSADILNSAFKSAVNNDGIIEADTFENKDTSELTEGFVLLRSNQNIELNGQITASGAIDAYAQEDIILGGFIEELILSTYAWEYISKDSRTYKFKEFGYYYDEGDLKVVLSKGEDIGKISGSMSGSGTQELPGEPIGLYITMDPLSGAWHTLYEDATLNPDGEEHLDLAKLESTGTEYWWEDMVGLGDEDYNDVVIDFMEDYTNVQTPNAALDAPNIFLTAKNGSIKQISGDIYATENLMLEANTGITGPGSNGGIVTKAQNISALNGSSGDIRIENRGDLTIADLSEVEGLNTGVTGFNGITNNAVGGQVNIKVSQGVGDRLDVEAPVNSSGSVILTAEGDIAHNKLGDVTIDNSTTATSIAINLTSPSHKTDFDYVNYLDKTVDVAWEVETSTPGYGFTGTAGGSYDMDSGSEIVTNGGNATIVAEGDVTLSLVNAGKGSASITSNGGSIIDGDLGVAPSDYDVIAHNITLSADGDIGGAGPEEKIDLGHPYDFSHLWDNASATTPNTSGNLFDAALNSEGDWVFSTVSEALANGSWWFHVRTLEGVGDIAASDPAHIGPFIFSADADVPPPPPPPPSEDDQDIFWQALQENRVYYEILDPSRFSANEPAQPLGLYAYHPITPTDVTAFDNIKLDAGAYDFISDSIEMKKKANPYFGL